MSGDNLRRPNLQLRDATNRDESLYSGKNPQKQFEIDEFSDSDDDAAPNFDLLGSDGDEKQHDDAPTDQKINQAPILPRPVPSFRPPRPLLVQPAAPLPQPPKPKPISANPFARPIKEVSHIKLPSPDVKVNRKKEDRQTTELLDSFLGQTAAATNQHLQGTNTNGQRKRKIVQILWSDDDEVEEEEQEEVKEEEDNQVEEQYQRQDDDLIDLTSQQNVNINTVNNNNNHHYPGHQNCPQQQQHQEQPQYYQQQNYQQQQQQQQANAMNNTNSNNNSIQYWWMRFADFVPVNCLKHGINPRHGGTVYIDYKNQFSGKTGPSVGGASAAARAVIRAENAEARLNNNNNNNRSRQYDYDDDNDDDDGDGGGGRRGRKRGGKDDGNGGYWQQEGGSNVYVQANGKKLYGQLGYRAYLREGGKSGGSGTRGGGGGNRKKKAGGGGRGRRKQ